MTEMQKLLNVQHLEEEKIKKKKNNEESKKTNREQRELANIKKLDDYMIVINSAVTTNNNSNFLNNEFKQESKIKKTKSSNSKSIAPNEANENKFMIRTLIDKNDPETGKRINLNVLSDQIKEEDDEEAAYKMKKEILLNKLMCDKSIINDKTFANSFVDNVITLIYLSLSPESRNLLMEKEQQDPESNTFFHYLIGFNQENFLKNPQITNEIILYLCNNVLKLEDMFQSSGEDTKEKETEPPFVESPVQEVPELYNKLIFEEEVVLENQKETIVEIRNESNLEITGQDDSRLNESGLNALTEFIKNNQNKPITEKVENLFQIFSNNKINNMKFNLDNKTKNELLQRLREEFKKEQEVIDEEAKQIQKKNPLNKDSDNVNPFKSVLDASSHEDSNYVFANKGWGVGGLNSSKSKPEKGRKTNSVEKPSSKLNYKKENVTVRKFANNSKTPTKTTHKFKEDNKNRENFWIGDNNEDDESEEWMVLK